MSMLIILLVYYLGAVATLLLICRNILLEHYIVKYVVATLIWPITIIIGLITLIKRNNEENT